jgi:hypothetical protein
MPPQIGDMVIFKGMLWNGVDEHPAVITRVWTENCVNLMVFPDTGFPTAVTSVNRVGSRMILSTCWRNR